MKQAIVLFTLGTMLLVSSCTRSPVEPTSDPVSGWSLFGTTETLTDVSGYGDETYVLGHAGTVLRYDGDKWTASMPLHDRLYWHKLRCVSPRDIFIVGTLREVVGGKVNYESHVYHYDGSVTTPMTTDFPSRVLDLWGSSSDNVVAVGGNGMIQRYDGSSWTPIPIGTTDDIHTVVGLPTGELFVAVEFAVWHYDGSTWTEHFTSDEAITDIWASARDDVYVARGGLNAMHYDGESWTVTGGLGRTVWGTSRNDVYVAGSSTQVSHFDGQSWRSARLPIGDFRIADLGGGAGAAAVAIGNGVDDAVGPNIFLFDGRGWTREPLSILLPYNRGTSVISGDDNGLFVGGGYTTLLHFDGSSWTKYGFGAGGAISDIWTGPGSSAVAIGDYGLVAAAFDGAQWSRHNPPGEELTRVWGTVLADLFYVGWDGRIAHFDGQTAQAMESNTTAHLFDIWGRSSHEVYAVGAAGTILTYDGRSWRPVSSNTTETLRAIWGDHETAIAVGDFGTILEHKGGSWTPVESPTTEHLKGVWGLSSRDVYVVGDHSVLHYDGSDWALLNDSFGGQSVWGRSGDAIYAVDGARILRYGSGSTH